MSHLEKGTKVKVEHYSTYFNGLTGEVIDRSGSYYLIRLDEPVGNVCKLHDIYRCELEEVV